MKNAGWFVACVCALVSAGIWFERTPVQGAAAADGKIVAEGIIYSVSFVDPDGKISGFTRANNTNFLPFLATDPKSWSVPGARGSFSQNAYGVLYESCLVITYPDKKEFAEHVVPTRFLREVRFGMGGITKVAEITKP